MFIPGAAPVVLEFMSSTGAHFVGASLSEYAKMDKMDTATFFVGAGHFGTVDCLWDRGQAAVPHKLGGSS